MTEIFPQSLLVWGGIYAAAVTVASWFAMVVWAYRDMRARSRDAWAQILVGVFVFVLNLPGLIIYLLLRPRETLVEAYERSLEEEALLQEIEEKPTCPGCSTRVETDWQACPNCHTRLKKPCINCGEMLQLSWNLCPYCAVPQTSGAANNHAHVSRRVRVQQQQAQTAEPEYDYSPQEQSNSIPGLEFLDE